MQEAKLRIREAEVFRLPTKINGYIPNAPREWVVFNQFKGVRGLYLRLDGPFCYPSWEEDWKCATPLSKARAYAFAGSLGELHFKRMGLIFYCDVIRINEKCELEK